jgi:hypothetical protein
VLRGALVVITIVPATAPNDVVSTGIVSVFVSTTVAVKEPFNAAHAPVPPAMVTVGLELVSKPFVAALTTAGVALEMVENVTVVTLPVLGA